MYYMYCIKMGRSEPEFWNSAFRKVMKMIDMYVDEKNMQNAAMHEEEYESKYFSEVHEIKEIKSMREIEGW